MVELAFSTARAVRFFCQDSLKGPFPRVCCGMLLLHSTCDTRPILETQFPGRTCIANMPMGQTSDSLQHETSVQFILRLIVYNACFAKKLRYTVCAGISCMHIPKQLLKKMQVKFKCHAFNHGFKKLAQYRWETKTQCGKKVSC